MYLLYILLIAIISIPVDAQDELQFNNLKSVLDKLDNADYSQIIFYNLSNRENMEQWHITLSLPRGIRSTSSRLNILRNDTNWVIRAIVTKLYRNKEFVKEYEKSFPDSDSSEYWELIEKSGGKYKAKNVYLYLFSLTKPEEILNYLLEGKHILAAGKTDNNVRIFQWIENPLNKNQKDKAYLALIPNTNEMVMSTRRIHLVSLLNARMGSGDLAGDNMELWSKYEPFEKYIEKGLSWGLYAGQNLDSWESKSDTRNRFTEEEIAKKKDEGRWIYPLGRFTVFGLKNGSYLDRWIFHYDLNTNERRKMATQLKEGKLRGLQKWAKDYEAIANTVSIIIDGDYIVRDMIFDSEYKAWASSDPGFDHLDEKYKAKSKQNNLAKERE